MISIFEKKNITKPWNNSIMKQLLMLFQTAAVREGMSWIIPVPLLTLLTPKNLEQLVCGMEEMSVDVLRKVVR